MALALAQLLLPARLQDLRNVCIAFCIAEDPFIVVAACLTAPFMVPLLTATFIPAAQLYGKHDRLNDDASTLQDLEPIDILEAFNRHGWQEPVAFRPKLHASQVIQSSPLILLVAF